MQVLESPEQQTDFRISLHLYFSNISRALTEADESGNVEIGTSGCYSSVCLELDMASLAVNTLIQVCSLHWILMVIEKTFHLF